MDGDSGDRQDEGFSIVTVPMDSYVDASRFAEVAEVVAEAGGVAGLLGDWGGEHRVWKGEDRTLGATQVRLREWSEARPPRNSMLLWFGHGESNQDDAMLAVRGAGTDGEDDHITPRNWAITSYATSGVGRTRTAGQSWWSRPVVPPGSSTSCWRTSCSGAPPSACCSSARSGPGSGYVASFREVLASVLTEFSDNYSHIRLGTWHSASKTCCRRAGCCACSKETSRWPAGTGRAP